MYISCLSKQALIKVGFSLEYMYTHVHKHVHVSVAVLCMQGRCKHAHAQLYIKSNSFLSSLHSVPTARLPPVQPNHSPSTTSHPPHSHTPTHATPASASSHNPQLPTVVHTEIPPPQTDHHRPPSNTLPPRTKPPTYPPSPQTPYARHTTASNTHSHTDSPPKSNPDSHNTPTTEYRPTSDSHVATTPPAPTGSGTNENVVGNQFSNNAIVYVVFGIKSVHRKYDASHVIPEEGEGVSPQ